jgi:hypothetical protein
MNRLELAERRYRDIVTDELVGTAKSDRYWEMPSDRLIAWLEHYVVPAVGEVWDRPLFRDHSTWPQRSLTPGCSTDERRLVESVDRDLICGAKALLALAKSERVNGQLASLNPPSRVVISETAVINGDGVHCGNREFGTLDLLAVNRSQVEGIANRCWTDLVCLDDYFGPVGGMMGKSPLPAGVTEGKFVVSLNPNLFLVGDCISRSMLQRIDYSTECLREFRQRCYQAIQSLGKTYAKQVAVDEAWENLGRSAANLHSVCLLDGDARIRESCIVLTQTYAEFHPAADLSWLGIAEWARDGFSGRLRHNVISTRNLETIERIAGALGDLRLLYRELSPEQSAQDVAIGTGGLVLIEAIRKAYWATRLIDVDWYRFSKPWTLLWKLAQRARTSSAVGNNDLYDEGVPSSTIANRWARLKGVLPASLRSAVCPGPECATYRLTLAGNRIHLFPKRSWHDATMPDRRRVISANPRPCGDSAN